MNIFLYVYNTDTYTCLDFNMLREMMRIFLLIYPHKMVFGCFVSYKEFLFNKTKIQSQVAWDWLENRTDGIAKSQVQQQIFVCVYVCVHARQGEQQIVGWSPYCKVIPFSAIILSNRVNFCVPVHLLVQQYCNCLHRAVYLKFGLISA